MAQLSPRITADVVSANEFPRLSQRYRVMSVPKTVVRVTADGGEAKEAEFVGALPEARVMQVVNQVLAEAG